MATLSFVVDDRMLIADLERVTSALDTTIERLAAEAAEDLKSEAGQRSSRLGQPWIIEGTGPTERHVIAPEWWAHFLAGGTAAHGPTSAPKLVFIADGQMVFARYVRGIAADPFDVRALERTSSRADDLLRQLIAEAI